MSITCIQTLHDLAEISLATYAYLRDDDAFLSADFTNADTGASFTSDQVKAFTDHYSLVSTQSNIDTNGFSASVFEDKLTGEKVLAIRGTEFTQGIGQIITDGAVADALGIGVSGYANLQGVEMYRYWKKLNTVGGEAVIRNSIRPVSSGGGECIHCQSTPPPPSHSQNAPAPAARSAWHCARPALP